MGVFERMRLDWIGVRVGKVGYVNRRDLMETFGISKITASKDLTKFQRELPDVLVYNKSAKRYEAKDGAARGFAISGFDAAEDVAESVRAALRAAVEDYQRDRKRQGGGDT